MHSPRETGRAGGAQPPGRGRPVRLREQSPIVTGMSRLCVALRQMELFSRPKDIMFLLNIYCLKGPYMHESMRASVLCKERMLSWLYSQPATLQGDAGAPAPSPAPLV